MFRPGPKTAKHACDVPEETTRPIRSRRGVLATAGALAVSAFLLSACNISDLLGGVKEIDSSSFDSFISSYEKVIENLEEEDPAAVIEIRTNEQKVFKALTYNLDKLNLEGPPPEVDFDRVSYNDGMYQVYRAFGQQLHGFDAYIISRVYKARIDEFALDYAERIDAEIHRIEAEVDKMRAARDEIHRVVGNLIVDRINQVDGSTAIMLLNGSTYDLSSAIVEVYGFGERHIDFGPGGLSVGQQGAFFLPGVIDSPLERDDVNVVSVVLKKNGGEIRADEADQAMRLLQHKLDSYREFREGLEERIKKAL